MRASSPSSSASTVTSTGRRQGNETIDYCQHMFAELSPRRACRFALRSDADAICEKPLVLNPWNIDGARRSGGDHRPARLNDPAASAASRHHQALQAKSRRRRRATKIHEVDLTYITSRGRWYYTSWKGDESKVGRRSPRTSACISSTCSASCSAGPAEHRAPARARTRRRLPRVRARAGALVPLGRRAGPARRGMARRPRIAR